MHFSKTTAVLLIALSVAFAGCKKQQEATGAKQEGPGKGIVLAEVNGANITDKDFYKEQAALPPQLKPMTETPEGKKEMVDTMVVRELILQQAAKDGIDKSPEVAAKLEDLKRRVIVEAFLKKKIEESAKVSDAEMQDYYNKNKDKFKSDAQIRASHILVKSEALAKEIEKQLKGGASFEELAKKNSIDGAAPKGGDLGWFSKGSMIPDFEKVAFGLKDGETSGIVKTQFGYHIIKKTGSRPAGVRTLDEAKDEIKAALAPAKQQETFKKLKDDLKKQAKISFKEDALKELGGEGAKGGATHPADAQPAQPAQAK
ncbi:peptidylprolyl isomerase [Geomonas sp. Red69]|uniref:peptidylprolyl isomerase n=1 Tax=Geomonas diazotrophica TaxID=2843197 RepID=A0ABX8JKA9_9BACT|nr:MULTISPECIES: peptidyl-prolyl cis-trans isomerase [Geomonas]MBU5635388.1 peptidylprolyl isomerase [Geomonas diazotrophica]QWV97556.1 peptidylprolyl isomerase [Geomonas nitrogeniifigens]QXE86697.1 peptidylprolyl isomerase [Geomonas nitrogeniifigens]